MRENLIIQSLKNGGKKWLFACGVYIIGIIFNIFYFYFFEGITEIKEIEGATACSVFFSMMIAMGIVANLGGEVINLDEGIRIFLYMFGFMMVVMAFFVPYL